MSTILLSKKNGDPFVTKIGDEYFIEGKKYTDDLNLLLSAIAEVKEAGFSDITDKKASTKEEYWKNYFNHQWNGGGLILWTNPTEVWDQELTRRGEKFCEKCSSKLIMYYVACCPICDYDWKEHNLMKMIYLVEAKYKIDIRNYSMNGKSGNRYEINHKLKTEWEEKHFPIMKEYTKDPLPNCGLNEEGMKFFNTREGYALRNEIHIKYSQAKDGECLEIPYWDFWHLVCDHLGDFTNDCTRNINWGEVMEDCHEDWQKEVCAFFIKEFGMDTYKVEISW